MMAASFVSSALLHPARAMPAPRQVPGPPKLPAVKALSDLVLGKKVKFAFGGRHEDRHGRYLAQVFLEDGGVDE